MDCKKAKGLILTDYLDGRMGAEEGKRIEEHLAHCPECNRLSMAARKTGNELFAGIEKADVPEYLWHRVRETILAEERERRAYAPGFFRKLRAILYIPKPALAVAAVIIMLIAIGTMTKFKINNQAVITADMPGQTEYFDYLTTDAANSSMNDNGIFGTSIEKYFM